MRGAPEARFSVIDDPVGDEEMRDCCQPRINDPRQSVVPAIEALVGEQPSVRMLDDAASRTEPAPRAARRSCR